jgi:putative transposase
VSRYIDGHRGRFGVEPICRTLDVSASAYYYRASGERSQRVIEDERLLGVIKTTHEANYFAYGYRKMWLALVRAGETVGRDHVKRLMRAEGIQGAKRRGKPSRTTIADPAAARSPDVFSRRIVGWQFASHMRTDLVLDALRMALTRRGHGADVDLIHHSDAGSQPGLNGSSQHRVVGERTVAGEKAAQGARVLSRGCRRGGRVRRARPQRR